jgi:hypothetical protein
VLNIGVFLSLSVRRITLAGATAASLWAFGWASAQAAAPQSCQIAGSDKAAALLREKTIVVKSVNGCLFSAGQKNMMISEYYGASRVHNFRLLVNPKTMIVFDDTTSWRQANQHTSTLHND